MIWNFGKGFKMIKKLWEKFVDEKIIPYVCTCSKHPMRFVELLKSNKAYIDGLDPSVTIPGFRLSTIRLYIVYFILWNVIIIPVSLIFHTFLAKLDCHLSIVLAIIFTLIFFGTFQIFKEWLIHRVAEKIIKKAWQNHLPHFNYEKYRYKVAEIYGEAIDKEIPKYEIERYIIDRMVES